VDVCYDKTTGRLHFWDQGQEGILMPWPTMRAFRRTAGQNDWQAFEPVSLRVELRPDAPALSEWQDVFRRFAASVPAPLLQAIASYPDGHWALLSWAARCGVFADDLLKANPCLAYMLARAASFSVRPERSQPAWAARPYGPQKQLLGHLGFPRTEQMRRASRKIMHSAMSVARLVALRTALRREPEVLDRLSHLRRINSNVLVAASAGGRQVTIRLLARLAHASEDDPAAPLGSAIADTIRGWRLLHPRRPLPLFDHVAHIHRLHEQIVEELSHHKGNGTLPFPPPPVAGTDAIVPLRDALDLVAEGREQHNCVASYERLARRGEVALYKVTAPERATLSLVPDGCKWKVSELRGPCNRRVSPHTREAVTRWLAGTPRDDGTTTQGNRI
jgi:hypothetical protein